MENGAFALIWKMEHLLFGANGHGKWSICSLGANAPFSIIFSKM